MISFCIPHRSLRWRDSQICEALAGALQSASPCQFENRELGIPWTDEENALVTIEYTDGTKAAWVFDDDTAQLVETHIEEALGIKAGSILT